MKAQKNHLPGVLAALGFVGLVATVISTARKTPEAVEAVTEAESEKGEALDVKETVIAVAPIYAETAILFVATAACIVGSHASHLRLEGALLGGAALWQGKYHNLDKKLKEYSSGLHKKVKTALAKEEIEKDPNLEKNLRKLKAGNFLIYDDLTNQIIETNRERVNFASLMLNRELGRNCNVHYNYFIECIGGRKSKDADGWGWNFENEMQADAWGYEGFGPWVDLKFDLTEIEGQEVLYLYFNVMPDKQDPENMVWFNQ